MSPRCDEFGGEDGADAKTRSTRRSLLALPVVSGFRMSMQVIGTAVDGVDG